MKSLYQLNSWRNMQLWGAIQLFDVNRLIYIENHINVMTSSIYIKTTYERYEVMPWKKKNEISGDSKDFILWETY
jgi:hypothetical protein